MATVGALVGTGVLDDGQLGASATLTTSSTDTNTDASTGAIASPDTGSLTISASDAVVAVAEGASPAVVTITVESAGSGGFGPMSMPSTGVASGFVFDADGLILTNEHVIEGSGAITVTFEDGTELPATVVATDTVHDLAVVHVAATGLPTIPIGESTGDLARLGRLDGERRGLRQPVQAGDPR